MLYNFYHDIHTTDNISHQMLEKQSATFHGFKYHIVLLMSSEVHFHILDPDIQNLYLAFWDLTTPEDSRRE